MCVLRRFLLLNLEAQRAVVQRDTLRSVIALPKEIIEKGEKAQLALQQYADE